MAAHSLGKVTTASIVTAARATSNQSDPTANYTCEGFTAQAVSTNTGLVYICDTATPNLTTGVGILWEVAIPVLANGTIPLLSVDNPTQASGFNLANIYVLPTVTNEGVFIAAIKS